MKNKFLLVLCVLGLFFSNLLTSDVSARPAPDSFSDLVDKLLPMVVNISTSQTVEAGAQIEGLPLEVFPPGHPFEEFNEFFDQFKNGEGGQAHKEKLTSLGSGFIISEDGLVVTNHHVVANAEEITVTLNDDSQYDAKLVGSDAKTDLAVLRIEQKEKKVKFPSVKFGDSDISRVGDWVIAIGNPFNLGGTVTAGIISARARDINAGPFDDFIQTDAAINRGNSGGPMFNMDGEVIGINSAIFSPSGGNVGIGFAIPANLAQPIIKQLKEGKEITRGWLGVKIQTVSKEIAESLGLQTDKGALVVDVVEDSPAQDAGFEKGDIILEFDGKEVGTMRKLPRLVAETPVGKKVDVKLLRKGKAKTIQVELGKLSEEEKQAEIKLPQKGDKKFDAAEQLLGLKLLNLDDTLKEQFKLDKEAKGALIIDVDTASEAYAQGIRGGDLVTEINQQDVKEVADIKAAVKDAKSAGRKSVLLYINRQGEGMYIALPVDEKLEGAKDK